MTTAQQYDMYHLPAPVARKAKAKRSSPGVYRPVDRITVDGQAFKVCGDPGCGNRFPVEVNSRGQETSRRLCDLCREKRQLRERADLHIPAGVERCADCLALCGLAFGSVTHLDVNGRCSDCAAWEVKRMRRAQYLETQALIARLQNRVRALEDQVRALATPGEPCSLPESVDTDKRTPPPLAFAAMPVNQREAQAHEIATAYLALDRMAKDEGYEGVGAIEGRLRHQEIVDLRQGVMQALRARDWGLTLIGGFLARHHTTIMHGLAKQSDAVQSYRDMFERYFVQVLPLPEQEQAIAALVRQRAHAINPTQVAKAWGAGGSMAVPGPAGYVLPGALALRWRVPPGKVRYWISQGRLRAVKGSDGRLWLPADTECPGTARQAS